MKTKIFAGRSRIGLLLCLAGILSIAVPGARAQEKDPPTRVARISYIDGSVSLQPGGQGDWGSAAKNRPMTIGDKIWVDKDSRAELQAGQAAVHLGSMTALSFLNLDQGITQMRLAEGSINFRVRELREGDLYEVDAPNLAFTVKQAGAFRIDVSESGDSARITVIRGEGEVTAGGKTYEVHSGERGEFTGTDNIDYSVTRAPGPDGLDRWAEERDLKEDNSVSGRYVSRDVPGYSDLDDYGSWRDEPEYGHVWYPAEVEPGWAPYSYGYWNWVGPWGWTWVDYEPWGFAPFHYGRWNYFAGGWGWCPGPFFGPPIYGPAFVGFFGGGFGFGIGWFPLGFGEPFFPFFDCSRSFITVININNTFIRNTNVFNTNIHNINFVNAHNANAVTVASRNAFVGGQPINRSGVHVSPAVLKGAQVTNSVGLKPSAQSSLGAANIKSHVATPSAAVQNRAVVARTAPAQGASHTPVRTVNGSSLTVGRAGNGAVNSGVNRPNNGADRATNQRASTPNSSARQASGINNHAGSMPNSSVTARQRELSQNRPPSAMPNAARTPNSTSGNNAPQRGANTSRAWEAQGSVTDRGRAPSGFGSSGHPANPSSPSAGALRNDRPPWAGGSQPGGANSSARPSTPSYGGNRPNYSNSGRSYNPPSRSYSPQPSYSAPSGNNSAPSRSYSAQPNYSSPSRTYSAPSRSYSAQPNYSAPSRNYSAPSRSYSSGNYSAPSRSYSAPSRSYSAPSHSYSGGGGSYHGGGGGGGGGGSSHGSGGGGSHSSGGSGSHGHH